jgi:hypothetical protein
MKRSFLIGFLVSISLLSGITMLNFSKITHLDDSRASLRNEVSDSNVVETDQVEPLIEAPSIDLFSESSLLTYPKENFTFQCPDSGIFVYTYANYYSSKYNPEFSLALQTAALNDIPLNVIGWGAQYLKGHVKKMQTALMVTSMLPSDCIVMFNDAYDVLFTTDLMDIKNRFLRTGHKVIYSGECGCWPQKIMPEFGEEWCRNVYPPAPTFYRYLNSGGWIGYAGNMNNVIRLQMQEAENWNKTGKKAKGDQQMVAAVYVRGEADIHIDHYAEFFQNMYDGEISMYENCKPLTDVQWNGTHWENKVTKTAPAILHFSGPDKYLANNYFPNILSRFSEKKVNELLPNMWLRFFDDSGKNVTMKQIKDFPLLPKTGETEQED